MSRRMWTIRSVRKVTVVVQGLSRDVEDDGGDGRTVPRGSMEGGKDINEGHVRWWMEPIQ